MDLHKQGKMSGIADIIDQSSGDTLRLEIILSKDAVAKVVLNQLYKHTQLRETFGAALPQVLGTSSREVLGAGPSVEAVFVSSNATSVRRSISARIAFAS